MLLGIYNAQAHYKFIDLMMTLQVNGKIDLMISRDKFVDRRACCSQDVGRAPTLSGVDDSSR